MDTSMILQIAEEIKRYSPQLNGRVERGVGLWQAGAVVEDGPDAYKVYGNSDVYRVTFDGSWACTCPDCQNAPIAAEFGGVQPTCKHIVAAGLAWSIDGVGAAQ